MGPVLAETAMSQGRHGLLLAGLLATVGLAGCGGEADRLEPVRGRITVAGKPLPAGTVVFHPDAAHGNTGKEEPRGSVNGEGIYTLTTGGRAGAPPGWYKVAVFALKPSTRESGMRPPEWLANRRYSDAGTSGLSRRVVANPGPHEYDFDLQP
jgi:hypothetical protein